MDKEFSRVIEIDINDILPNRNQPRIMLNEEDDLGLTDSIKEYGVLQPILVRSIGDKYEIVAGERRYRASALAGKDTIPAIVINMNDKESAEVALIENIQRKQLSPIEEALSYKSILDKGYMTQEQLAEKIGKSQPTIANKIRLLNLSDEVQDALLENQISERHARSLLKIKDKATQNEMLDKIIKERLTVRKTDEEINKILEEKGEENMNNNEINNMPQFQSFESKSIEAPVPQFEMYQAPAAPIEPISTVQPASEIKVENPFGNTVFEPVGSIEPTPVPQYVAPEPVQENTFVQPQPVVEPVTEPAATTIPQFDIFQNATTNPEPVQENTFVQPQPVVEPVTEPAATTIPQFDIFQNAQSETDDSDVSGGSSFTVPQFNIFQNATTNPEPVQPVENTFVQPQPVVEPEQPTFSAFQQEEPIQTQVEETPAQESNVTLDGFTTSPVQENTFVQPEVKPEPIIITDYNKQYDPVMPAQEIDMAPHASFKDVIAAIRECADKIESYGYKIDVDEFDLTNIYQAIFKIEKM